MSRKTLRSSSSSAIALTSKRLPLRKLYVACAAGLFVLAPSVSAGLELGSATLGSRLGEPLLVEIPYRLTDGERLTPDCVGLAPPPRSSGALPSYARASRVAITPTHIRIFGDSRVLEPLIGVTVGVRCASAPNFVRSYEFFVDPPSYAAVTPRDDAAALAGVATRAPAARAAERAAPTLPSAEAPRVPRAESSARARGQTGGTLAQGQTYVVVRGDTLSGIAARVGDRPDTVRATADAIYAANLEAFARGDRNLLQAGRVLTIPLLGEASTKMPATPEPVTAPAVSATTPSPVVQPIVTELPPLPVSEAAAPRADVATSAVPEPVEPLASAAPVAQPSAAPEPSFVDSTPAAASASDATPGALWLALLSALAGAIASAVVILWIGKRRRRQEPPPRAEAKPRAVHRRRIVDPTAGIDVIEGELPRAAMVASESPTEQAPLVATPAAMATDFDPGSLPIGANDAVDLDVGMPTAPDAGVDDSGDRTATLQQPTVEAPTAVLVEANVEDAQHTLTIVELDMLRADYEAEHTLTQESSEALRDAIADLKATAAERAASTETATLKLPQQAEPESIETQPTRQLRASR